MGLEVGFDGGFSFGIFLGLIVLHGMWSYVELWKCVCCASECVL